MTEYGWLEAEAPERCAASSTAATASGVPCLGLIVPAKRFPRTVTGNTRSVADVFISYKREERALCQRIRDLLAALDLDVWFDERLTAGLSFDREIERALKASRCVLVLWSPEAVESEWVREEASFGKNRGVLAAARVAPCQLPFGFSTVHCEDLFDPFFVGDDPSWLKLLARLGELTDRPGLADFSAAFAQLDACAARHPSDALADKARAVAAGGAVAVEGAIPPRRVVHAPPKGPVARWAAIEHSLDPEDFTDFLVVFPGAEEAFEARRNKRRLEAWARVDQTDIAEVAAFLKTGPYLALRDAAQRIADRLAAADEQARSLSVPPWATASASRDAALVTLGATPRSFGIELLDVANHLRTVMVALPPGRFSMGSHEGEEGHEVSEAPQHEVEIDYVFAIGAAAVTREIFSRFLADTGHDMGEGAYVLADGHWVELVGRGWQDPGFPQGGDHPVTCVNWWDAQAFLAWLNDRTALAGQPDAYRLPSEAEWEYACRAGTHTPFAFGHTLSTEAANFNGRVAFGGEEASMVWRRATTPAGRLAANRFGIHDMHGNVWEWCEDSWNQSYLGAPNTGEALPAADGAGRVRRGGSWDVGPQRCRSAARFRGDAAQRGSNTGFRLARTLSA